MIYYQANSALVIPPDVPLPKGFSKKREEGITYQWGLLLLHPFTLVRLRWEKYANSEDLRAYIFQRLQIPQSRCLPRPDFTMRVECFDRDLEEVGLSGSILTPPPPRKDLCRSSELTIRRLYAKDFTLGDYE